MSATKYQVMYRYMNAIMNVAITNDQSNAYEEVREFYTDPDHRIFSSDINIQNEELDKQQEIIVDANKSDNPKNDMLFVYAGTKKIPHQVFKPTETGYVVKHWQLLPRSKIGNQGDFTKDFTTINAATPEDGGTVICTAKVMNKYFKAGAVVPAGKYTSDEIDEMFNNYTVFQFKDEDWTVYAAPSSSVSCYSGRWSGGIKTTLYTGPVFIDGAENNIVSRSGYAPNNSVYINISGCLAAHNVYGVFSVSVSSLQTVEIPEHYEDSPENPYMIKDTYTRIEDSPWMINCITGSLTAAMAKAKKIVDILGIENVKVIKLVAVDQFIKIK